MKPIKRGHIYLLDNIAGREDADMHIDLDPRDPGTQEVAFVNKEPGQEADGTTTQEIVRMLIDRTHYCNNCLPHWVNEQIIWHFRQVIALHEARALLQKSAKGEMLPEFVGTAEDGHFAIEAHRTVHQLEEVVLKKPDPLGSAKCDHRSHL